MHAFLSFSVPGLFSGRTACVLSEKQVRCKDIRFIAKAFMQEGVAQRLLSLHLDGNLIADKGAGLLVRDIVLNPDTQLTFLNLSGNSKLTAAGVKHIAFGLDHPECALKEPRARGGAFDDAVALL